MFKVVEKFVSINGEGTCAGELAVFIRFAGCNLNCSYCDTKWANDNEVSFELMTAEDIYNYVKSTGVTNVTLTGGEPLKQGDILQVIRLLAEDKELKVEIETNGSVDLSKFSEVHKENVKFTMDYKLPSSNMEDKMFHENFNCLESWDTVKFVAGSYEDLKRAKEIIYNYNLVKKTNVYISPVFGQISLEDIVDFMKENNMNGVTLQVQLHKIIWDVNKRGV